MKRGAGRALGVAALTAALATQVAALSQAAGELDTAGSIGFDLRWFPDEAAQPVQDESSVASATFEPELRWRGAERRHQLDLALFARWDEVDDERSHVDVREASYRYVGNRLEVLAGVSRVFWGVTESRHLVDVINQTDAVEDIDEEDKLGQPMLRLALSRDWGRLELYTLFGARERTFPGRRGRLRPPLPVEATRPRYEASRGDDRIDWALRWSRSVGAFDLGLATFHGTAREPQFALGPEGRTLVPVYAVTRQYSVDAQWTLGAWLLKLEAMTRSGQGETFGAAVAGFERTLFQVGGSGADLGLLLELLWDGRGATAPPTLYDEDTFLGLRLALNDIQDTEILAGVIVDHDDGSRVAVVEASRRLGSRFVLSLDVRHFAGVDPGSDLAAVERDGFANLRLAWHW
ncbi:MAG: hypothetical protein DWQ36_06670 [Acidobacteria bacterium]|nr:MAG: hypothetical protein DWQ36_06670 [Acidobacteriota bacterium]